MDYDGTTTYGPVVPVQFRNTDPVVLNVYPNPTLDNITLSLSGTVEGNLDISVWNVQGQQITMLFRSGIDATRTVPLSLEGLPAGMYIVRVSDGGTWIGEERVMKQ